MTIPSPQGECIHWTGWIDRDGYGRVRGRRLAHRVAYEAAHGPIPPGLEIDHLCFTRDCVNVAHLDAVTHQENCRRSAHNFGPREGNHRRPNNVSLRTHCKRGHEFTPQNTYFPPSGGSRQCRMCVADHTRAYKARRRQNAGSKTP